MRGCLPILAHRRAIMGVIALYGLLLQAFLTAATPVVLPDLTGAICAVQDGAHSGPPDGPSLPHDHQCCTAVHAGGLPPPPAAGAAAIWRAPATTPVVWRSEAAVPKTGPPNHAHSARGPPSA